MSDMRYFGSYATFRTKNKNEGAVMMGADHLVGMRYTIEFETTDGKTVAWAKNPYGNKIGYFDNQVTYRLDVMRARGWNIYAVLSLVGITDHDENKGEGYYWGEVALFSCPAKYANEVETFIGKVSEQLVEGTRPDIDLTSSSIDLMLQAKGDWMTNRKVSLPNLKKGSAILKKSQSLSEKAVEKGRAGNKGCYAISWAFIAILVVAALFLIKTLFGW